MMVFIDGECSSVPPFILFFSFFFILTTRTTSTTDTDTDTDITTSFINNGKNFTS